MNTPFVGFDWDGVLHRCRSYHPGPFVDVELAPLRMALARGWRVQIFTANDDMAGIRHTLAEAGIKSFVDYGMRYRDWDGGHRGQVVIISQRKMWTDLLVDDRALTFRFGDGSKGLIYRLEQALEERRREREASPVRVTRA